MSRLTDVPTRLRIGRVWLQVTRLVMLVGLVVPGILLVSNPGYWSTMGILATISNVPVPVWVYGIALLVGAALLFSRKFRDIGYTFGAIVYGLFTIGLLIGLVVGIAPISVLAFSLPIVVWGYLHCASLAIRERDNLDDLTQYLPKNDDDGE